MEDLKVPEKIESDPEVERGTLKEETRGLKVEKEDLKAVKETEERTILEETARRKDPRVEIVQRKGKEQEVKRGGGTKGRDQEVEKRPSQATTVLMLTEM